jgi:hypothetical protein
VSLSAAAKGGRLVVTLVHRRRHLGRLTRHPSHSGALRLTVHLDAAGRRLLRRDRRLRVKVVVTVASASGVDVTVERAVELRR